MADTPSPPLIAATLRDILDGFLIVRSSDQDTVMLNRLQLVTTMAGDRIGLMGLSAHAQIFAYSGQSLSERVGDIQTADAIEATPMIRLFEAWIEKQVGSTERNVALRVGMLDLNADFDSIVTANWLVNSSHGVGAELAKSGLNGPSIYPVSSLGLRLSITPNKRWTMRMAVLDGVPGIPDHPRLFIGSKIASGDGALTIAQVDYRPSDAGRIAVGAWRYSQPRDEFYDLRRRHDQGVYLGIEGSLLGSKHWAGWMRGGIASGAVQQVEGYLGIGIAGKGLWPKRPDDRIGFAIAHAILSTGAVAKGDLPTAETSFEVSYQVKLNTTIAIQPDFQYIRHPAAVSGSPDAFVSGLRLILSVGGPKPAPATDAADPTVPDDTPQTQPASEAH